MCKTIKRCFDEKLTFEKLLEAHNRASKGKKNKKELIIYEMDLETNIINLINKIKQNKYKTGSYREFKVYEPKERIIKSLPYQDRIVHQWYIEEFIKPYFYPRFIKDTYACLDNRGTHKAVLKIQKYMRKMQKKHQKYFVLKCDIKKFFYSIDKDILTNIIKAKITDKKLIAFTQIILNDGEKIGIPIGNYTSQYFANIYLNELDHYIKEKLKIEYYVRYMDDFILLVKTKQEARILKEQINEYVVSKLHLQLNKKSKYFPNTLGIDFCGYKIFETHTLLRKRFKKKVKKNVIIWKYLRNNNILNISKMEMSWNSCKAHMKHANSHNFLKKIEEQIEQLNKI